MRCFMHTVYSYFYMTTARAHGDDSDPPTREVGILATNIYICIYNAQIIYIQCTEL
jgi:hypothetical protein